MAAKMERSSTPGIYRRGSRYVVVWEHRGKQHKCFPPHYEPRPGRRRGDATPATSAPRRASRSRTTPGAGWTPTAGERPAACRAGRGRSTAAIWSGGRSRYFHGCRLEEVEPPDVRAFIATWTTAELRPASIRAILAPVKAMYATAVEDGAVRSNPTRGVRIGGDGAEAAERARRYGP